MERKFSLWMKLGEGIERIGVSLGDVALLLARSGFEFFCHILAS